MGQGGTMTDQLLEPPHDGYWPDAFHILASYTDGLTTSWRNVLGDDDGMKMRRAGELLYLKFGTDIHPYTLTPDTYLDIPVYLAQKE